MGLGSGEASLRERVTGATTVLRGSWRREGQAGGRSRGKVDTEAALERVAQAQQDTGLCPRNLLTSGRAAGKEVR